MICCAGSAAADLLVREVNHPPIYRITNWQSAAGTPEVLTQNIFWIFLYIFFPGKNLAATPGLGPQRAAQRTENKHVVVCVFWLPSRVPQEHRGAHLCQSIFWIFSSPPTVLGGQAQEE
jgi:hypothetical protein